MATVSTTALGVDSPLSLPSHYYSDPEIYQMELDRIFYRNWLFVGFRSELENPGDYITKNIGSESIFVVRSQDGTLNGFYNVCRHRAHRLLEGNGHIQDIVCPYHAWRYNLDGILCFARNSKNVDGFDSKEFRLQTIQVEDFSGFIFINLDPDASPLVEQVPTLEEEFKSYEPNIDNLQLVYRRHITIESNWKNVVDNYNENYHTPKVHPILASILDDSYTVTLKGKYLRHESNASSGEDDGFQVNVKDYPKHVTWWLWPNLCPMSIPGGGFRVLNILPTGPNQTHETYDFYLPYTEPNAQQWAQIKYAVDVVNQEDITVVESIQKGLKSRSFNRSYIMIDQHQRWWSEHAIAHFRDMILQSLRDVY